MYLPLLGACFLPATEPDGPLVLAIRGDVVTLGGRTAGTLAALAADPTSELDDTLIEALGPVRGKDLEVVLPPDTNLWMVRKLVGSAREAGARPATLGAIGNAERFPLSDGPRYGIEGACSSPRPVTGTAPLVTLSVQTGADGAWVLGTAQFLPVFGPDPEDVVDGLPADCFTVPPCDVLYPTDGVLQAACAAGGGDRRVGLGGAYGCLLPIARSAGEVGAWRTELPQVLSTLGLGTRPLLLVMPEARVRLDAILAVLGGFRDAGLAVPAVGLSLLVEGNDGPPLCNAPVRDAAGLAASGARWLGEVRRSSSIDLATQTFTPTAAEPPPQ